MRLRYVILLGVAAWGVSYCVVSHIANAATVRSGSDRLTATAMRVTDYSMVLSTNLRVEVERPLTATVEVQGCNYPAWDTPRTACGSPLDTRVYRQRVRLEPGHAVKLNMPAVGVLGEQFLYGPGIQAGYYRVRERIDAAHVFVRLHGRYLFEPLKVEP